VTRDVAGIVLAAGEGRRYGGPKALINFDGRPLAERGVATLLAGGCRPVFVVVGASAAEIEAACDLASATVVRNASWHEGMASSLRTGLDAAERAKAGAALVLQVDQPVVLPALVERLIAVWRTGAVAAAASYGGQALNPVVLDRSVWDAVRAQAHGEQGARVVLRANPHLVTAVACDDVGDPRDIDEPGERAPLELRYRELVLAAQAIDETEARSSSRLGSDR
jgi:CTP:molybdopterin cytidylyltransferase MocA